MLFIIITNYYADNEVKYSDAVTTNNPKRKPKPCEILTSESTSKRRSQEGMYT